MKTLSAILISMMLAVSFSINAGSHGHSMEDGQDGRLMGVMGDYHSRSMMMDQIVEDPEMRQDMMDNPEMMSMMKMHMMCAQTMNDGIMGEHSMENSEEHTH